VRALLLLTIGSYRRSLFLTKIRIIPDRNVTGWRLLVCETGQHLKRKVILTVEDEFLISAYLDDVLADAGYEVISTHNADEAIRVLEQRDDIGLIITDIDMPGSMNGLKLAAAVRDRWPPVEIVITTGKQRPAQDQMPAAAAFIPKPYTPRDVLRTVGGFGA